MKRILLAIVTASAVLSMSAGTALGAGVVDQQQTDVGGWNGGSPIWDSNYLEFQTFTAGVSRQLQAVSVYAGYWGPTTASGSSPTGQVMLEIVPVSSDGTPNLGFVYAREFKNLPFTPTWITYTLSTPFNLVAGTKYAIVLQAQGQWGLDWLGSCVTNYAGGQALAMDRFDSFSLKPVKGYRPGSTYCTLDLGFKTIVASVFIPVPLPSGIHIILPTATPTPTPSLVVGTPRPIVFASASPSATSTDGTTTAKASTPQPSNTAASSEVAGASADPSAVPGASVSPGLALVAAADSTASPDGAAGPPGAPGDDAPAGGSKPSSDGGAPPVVLVAALGAIAALAIVGGFAVWRISLRAK